MPSPEHILARPLAATQRRTGTPARPGVFSARWVAGGSLRSTPATPAHPLVVCVTEDGSRGTCNVASVDFDALHRIPAPGLGRVEAPIGAVDQIIDGRVLLYEGGGCGADAPGYGWIAIGADPSRYAPE